MHFMRNTGLCITGINKCKQLWFTNIPASVSITVNKTLGRIKKQKTYLATVCIMKIMPQRPSIRCMVI